VTRNAPLAFALILGGLATPAPAESLKIDADHSTISFKVRHLFTKVSGQFRKFEGTIEFDEKSLGASSVSATIQAASIDTNVAARDKDLRSARFFDVEKFPTLTFESLAISDVSGARGSLKGTLTMHGVKRDVTLATEFLGKGKDPWGNLAYGFHAETTVNRKEFGMTWNEAIEAGGVLVGDDVEISLDIEAMPAS
jgi:polyisoprenoid-binding protein YceI